MRPIADTGLKDVFHEYPLSLSWSEVIVGNDRQLQLGASAH